MGSISPLICIAGAYVVMSAVTLIAYGIDKRRAEYGRWRVSERRLHLLEMLGGWPGALAGQLLFRHKRRKLSYVLGFAGIVILHVAAWIAIYTVG